MYEVFSCYQDKVIEEFMALRNTSLASSLDEDFESNADELVSGNKQKIKNLSSQNNECSIF